MAAPQGERNAPVWVTVLFAVLGILLILMAVVYFSRTAGHLPSYFPGHLARSSHRHTKHGIAALILGIAALAAAWLSSGRKRPT
jgi:hypothetical protein